MARGGRGLTKTAVKVITMREVRRLHSGRPNKAPEKIERAIVGVDYGTVVCKLFCHEVDDTLMRIAGL